MIEALSLVYSGQISFQLVCFGLILMHPSPTAQTLAKSSSFVPPSQTGKEHTLARKLSHNLSHPHTKHKVSLYIEVFSTDII